MRKLVSASTAVLLVLLLVLGVPAVSLGQGQGGNIECPDGSSLVAKFNWNGSTYVFEKPAGNEDAIDITGDETGGTWQSNVGPIAYVIIKGATQNHTYEYIYNNTPEGVESGTFSAEDFEDNPSGEPPAISNIQFCAVTTAIQLAEMGASANASAGEVTVRWETATELDNAGFNLYRSDARAGPWMKVNAALIGAEGADGMGATYSFVDAPGTGTFFYALEDVSFSGGITRHDPVEVTVDSLLRRPTFRSTSPIPLWKW